MSRLVQGTRPELAIYDDDGDICIDARIKQHHDDIIDAMLFPEKLLNLERVKMKKMPKQLTRKQAEALVKKYRRIYPKIRDAWNMLEVPNSMKWRRLHDNGLVMFMPKNKEELGYNFRLIEMEGFNRGYKQAQGDEKLKTVSLNESQRREAQTAMTEMAKAMTKMAYNLMMINNGGKPFNGS